MANKFTQSVLQRLEQEQKIQPKAKSQTKIITKKPVTLPNIIENKSEIIYVNEQTSIDKNKIENDVQNMPDISDYLRLEPARTAKNKTFYLDVEVIDALCAAARRQHVTDSKLCNDILRRVLGIGSIH